MITENEIDSRGRVAEAKLYLLMFITNTLSKKIPDLTIMELLSVYQDLSMDLTKEAIKDEWLEENKPHKPHSESLSVRQFWGNDDSLCKFSCPFCTDSVGCYCTLYKKN